METQRAQEIEGELEQLRSDAENAQLNMEIFGLDSYNPRQLHEWKNAFEEGLDRIGAYSNEYLIEANDVSISGMNARMAVKSCIDYLTNGMVSRTRLNREESK